LVVGAWNHHHRLVMLVVSGRGTEQIGLLDWDAARVVMLQCQRHVALPRLGGRLLVMGRLGCMCNHHPHLVLRRVVGRGMQQIVLLFGLHGDCVHVTGRGGAGAGGPAYCGGGCC
jgi:hypothetical protein